MKGSMTKEEVRLSESAARTKHWKRWGPYLSERQWGTVREDYSPFGNAWEYFPHDHARSRTYRWGEDGLAGFSDDQQRLCLSLALWNGRDPILKERLFGLTNGEGNHGEDVKELYYYLDATPSHSYLKMLYKYPQAAFPYADLVHENRRRGIAGAEYELLDTGLFEQNRYFDVFVEYAQATPGDVLVRITVHNRGPEDAPIHLLPTLLFRNTWSWKPDSPRPVMRKLHDATIEIEHETLGKRYLYVRDAVPQAGHRGTLFCDNETNSRRLWGDESRRGFPKDGINDHVIAGDAHAVNPAGVGTKAAFWYERIVPAGGMTELKLRLTHRHDVDPFR